MKKAVTCLLVLALMCSLAPAALADWTDNFNTGEEFQDGTYKDVPADAWCLPYVARCWETRLMRGTTDVTFAPAGNITLAQTIAIAARVDSIRRTGKADFVQGTPWYQVYMDYCDKHSIILAERYPDPDLPATRREFARILCWSMDHLSLVEINEVDAGAIPDVPKDDECADEIYKLYRAGVLTGSDTKGTFHPDDLITRAEASAVVARLVDPTLRQSITLKYSGLTYWSTDVGGVTFKIPIAPKGYTIEGAEPGALQMVSTEGEGNASILMIQSIADTGSESWYFELHKDNVCDLLLDNIAAEAGVEPDGEAQYRDITLAGLSGMAAARDYVTVPDEDGFSLPVRLLVANAYDPAADSVITVAAAVIAPGLWEVDYTAEFWKLLETAVPAAQ